MSMVWNMCLRGLHRIDSRAGWRSALWMIGSERYQVQDFLTECPAGGKEESPSMVRFSKPRNLTNTEDTQSSSPTRMQKIENPQLVSWSRVRKVQFSHRMIDVMSFRGSLYTMHTSIHHATRKRHCSMPPINASQESLHT